ncbi:MAG TPA: hypothetical protein HPQ00_08590 [Magnetococcales bacterium]|nr:hypothetical protein [Magnetococcales bacterium]
MASYTLNASFTNADLNLFYQTGTNLIIAKPTQQSSGVPNVAWLVIRPMQSNTIVWDENYGIYASTSSITNGATLTKMSTSGMPAVMGRMYNLSPAGTIDIQPMSGDLSSFTLTNLYNAPGTFMTVGLYQNANVNGSAILGNALSAAPVIYSYQAVITPFTTIYMWMQSQVRSNTVITNVTSTMTQVTFGGGVNTASMQYNPSDGTFITAQGNNTMLLSSMEQPQAMVHHLLPQL